MKIQIVSWRDPLNPKAGGAEVCLTEIARRLITQYGHEVAWFAPRFAGSAATETHHGIAIERRGRFATIHAEALRRFRGRGQDDADLFLEDYHGLTLGLAWVLRKPLVLFVHEVAGPIWLTMWRAPLAQVGYVLEKLSLRLLGSRTRTRPAFIAVSPSTTADLVAHGIPRGRIATISEGSDLPRRALPLPRAERRAQLLFVGRICQMKRVDLLVEAFARVRNPSLRLVLAGTMDETFRPTLDALVTRLGISDRVVLAGRVSQEEKARLLAESLALVSGSMHEGFGLVVVEANSQGTPALTFDVPGYRDLVEPGRNGHLVPFPDTHALATKMHEVAAQDDVSYDRLAVTSLETSQKYSWDETAADVNRILEEVGKP